MTSPRPDTRVLVAVPITTDLGQIGVNLTASGAAAYEDPSVRTALDGTGDGRAIEVACELDNIEASVILCHGGDVASRPYCISAAAGNVKFIGGGVTLATIAAPSVGGTARDYIVAWSSEPNPGTTGAPDALRSVCLVYDVASASLAWAAVDHAVYAADVAGALSIGGLWDGAVMQLPFGLTIDGARVSARYHTRVEVREHWVAQTAAPTPLGITAVEDLVLPGDVLLPKSLVGPQYQAAAASLASGRNRHRLASPLAHWIIFDFPTFDDDLGDVVGPSRVYDMGDGYQSPICWLLRRKIPTNYSHLWVTVQWSTASKDANPPDVVDLRVHTGDAQPSDAQTIATSAISRAVEDAGLGVIEVFPPVFIVRDDDGWSWIYLSARTDGGSGSGNVDYSLHGLALSPMAMSVGFNGAPPAEWGP